MKVVCDTNVLIAGLIAEGLCRDIVKRRLPALELFTSQALLDELAEKLQDKSASSRRASSWRCSTRRPEAFIRSCFQRTGLRPSLPLGVE